MVTLGTLAACCVLRAWAAPPPDLPKRAYQPPPIVRETLPNGLRIVVQENHRIPLTTMAVGVNAGASVVPAGQAGMEDTLAWLMGRGTTKHDKTQLSELAKNLGGSLSITAGKDYAVLTGTALAKNADRLLDLMAENLLSPKLPQEDLRNYVYSMKRQVTGRDADTDTNAMAQLYRAFYGKHPYGTVQPTTDSLNAMTVEAVHDFYDTHYRPDGAVLLVVGDVDAKEIVRKAEALFGGWKKSGWKMKPVADPPLLPWNRVYLVDRPGAVQSNVLIGNVVLKVDPTDAVALEVANAILGGKTDSRLFATVREKYGYAYDVHSDVTFGALSAEFIARVECRTKVTVPAIKEIVKQTEALGEKPVESRELTAAKNFLGGKFVKALETQIGLANLLFETEYYRKPTDYLATYRSKVDAVTAEDVQRVAKKYLLPGRAAIVVVGDAGALAGSIADVGYVQNKKE